ncbi:hypothetical protein C6Q12_04145 [Burkholderia multivorans]|uniref:hypothetical protein n=1 Tax=Burkholderia multivorans TaxID=87883 RepID=UPI000D000C96|nr:hypothetical protein [Burkholderia multivorans]PRF79694.1 hypothetical protein C6Q12_04145 [Burkholderia multivorans]
MPNDNVLTEQIRAMCNAHVVTMGDDFALGADRLAKRILALLAAHPCQPEPSGEVTAFTTTVGRMLATAPHFEECETPEPCLSALIYRYYENYFYFYRDKGREHAKRYIAALYDAARAQGGES